jgi:ketosteroid isomerase-like protein
LDEERVAIQAGDLDRAGATDWGARRAATGFEWRDEAGSMSERDDFAAWTQSQLREAETALHNGDPRPRLAIWSTREPVSVLGAWRSAVGQEALRALFHNLADTFSNCTSHVYEIVAADVVGDMAFTVGYERTQASINGEPRQYVLRVTQVYRREDGDWKVVHRHADTASDSEDS